MSSHRIAMLIAVALLSPIALPLVPTAAAATLPSQLPTFGVFQHPTGAGDGAGEPTVGINWATGKVMFQDFATTWRVDFDLEAQPPTATWVDASAPNSIYNIDPMLFTDVGAGRTYAGGLDGECSIMSYTDNDGADWTPMGNLCAGAFDHQSIVAGPWKEPAPVQALHGRAAYYCAQYTDPVYLVATGPLVERDACITSYDGGITWGPPSVMSGPCGGLHGHLNVSTDGTAYLPVRGCDGFAGFGWTTDNGLTWDSKNFPEYPIAPAGFDSSVATSSDDRLWFAFERQDWIPMVGWSDDHGATFPQGFKAVGADKGIRTATFLRVMSGDPDRAALAYLGSTTDGNPFDPAWPGVWHLYVSFTYDGGATWETVQVTQDPVQRGWMCADGIGCGDGRNLLDFMGSAVDAQGRVIVGYADGCIGSCALPSGTASQSTAARSTIARQLAGKGLFAEFDDLVTGVDITSPLVGAVGQPYALTARVDAAMPYEASLSWGDGATQQLAGLTSTIFTASHAYSTAGAYDITLSIVGSDGATASDTATVAVAGDGGNGGTVSIESPVEGAQVEELVTVTGVATLSGNAAPVAAFSFTTSGRTAQFNAAASADADGDPLTFSWTFGDGANGVGVAPTHTYDAPGTYEACVVVSDGLASDELCRGVSIASTGATTLGTDPEGDAPSPTGGNIDDMDIVKLEATRSAAGEPVFILSLKTMAAPDAHLAHGGDGGQWHVEWTGPQGLDFVELNAALATNACQWGYFDEATGLNSGQGAAECTVTPGTPGKITITYPASAMASRGYDGDDTLAAVGALTGIYRGTPQDIPVWAGGTTEVDTLEGGDLVLTGNEAMLRGIGLATTARARAAPGSAPSDPHVTDRVSDPIGDNVPTTNIESAWFDSDAEFLYVGLKVQDVPADPTSTAFIYYAVNFKPSYALGDATWNSRVGDDEEFVGLRAFALYSPVRGAETLPPGVTSDTATVFELHLMDTDGTRTYFESMGIVQGDIDPTTDIVWWAIPRTVLQNPPGGGALDATSAQSAPAVGGLVSFNPPYGDSTGDGASYAFPRAQVEPPTVTLTADVSSGSAPLAVTFTAGVTPASVATWSMDFGDGAVLTGGSALPATFAHVYEGIGAYDAVLRVTAPDGGVGQAHAGIEVGSGEGGEVAVRLDVPGLAPVMATCGASCATWSGVLDLAPLADGPHVITATLVQGGEEIAVDTVAVQLTRAASIVIDAPVDGADVEVGPLAVTGRVAATSDRAPTALLGASQDQGLAPLAVDFTLDGVDDHGIVSWTFSTGDGRAETGTSVPASISHVYQTAGTYTATLVVRDTLGRTDDSAVLIRAQGENRAPTAPASPFPANGAVDVPQNAVLTWASTDADGNALTFDVYLDTADASTPVATGQSASYMPSGLEPNTTYAWRVVASDGIATTDGPVWTFTTKAAAPSEASKPHVVVAVIDTGTNPYHEDFRRAHLVEHPSTYITGLPAAAKQVNLCFFDNATKTVDASRCPDTADAAATQDVGAWSEIDVTPHTQVGAGQGKLVWFAGTNVLAVSFDHEGNPDYPTLDGAKGAGQAHGTWTSSNVAGFETGTCPECIVVLLEGDSVEGIEAAYKWAANQPWIDVITSSMSIGVGVPVVGLPLGWNPADFFDATSGATKTAVQNGKIVFEASGNGILNAAAAPTSTFLYANAAPWTIPVGCSSPHTGQSCAYSDFPNPITGTGIERMSASPDSYVATEGATGTSFSSPSSAGVAARALHAIRAAYGDTQEGPSATGAKSLVRVGSGSAPAQGPLANGALTRLELEEVIFKTARRSAVPELPTYIFPVEMLNSPANVIKEGFGNVYSGDSGVNHPDALDTWTSSADVASVILGQKALPNRFVEEAWWEVVVTPAQEEVFAPDVPDTDSDAFPRDDEPSADNLVGYAPEARGLPVRIGADATVPLGAAVTPENKRVYLHHNNLGPDPADPLNDVMEFYMNSIADPTDGAGADCSDASCPDQSGMGGTGIGTAGTTQTYTLLYPALDGPVVLDTTKDVVVHVEASGFLAGPTAPLSMTASLFSGGTLLGTVAMSGAPGVDTTVFEGRFKPVAAGLVDPVELTLSWAGPVYSLHVQSQGASWMDLPVTASLPPVDGETVTYYLDDLDAGFSANGDTVSLTRDITKLQGDGDSASTFPVPQANGFVINLAAEDVLVASAALLGSSGVASIHLCAVPTNGPDGGAAIIHAKVALELDGQTLGSGSVTKEIVGLDDGESVPVSVPLALRPVLLTEDLPLMGSIVISGPEGVATPNIGICGGSAAHPWSLSFEVADLATTPAVTLDPLADTVSGTVTVSGTASFPTIQGVATKTWYATDMADWVPAEGTVVTLDTTGPGTGSDGPIFQPDGLTVVFRSARPVAQDAPTLATDGIGRAQFWVTAVGAAPRVTVDMAVVLEDPTGAQRLLGSGSVTKDIVPPLGTISTLWDEKFVIDFVPAVAQPDADEHLVLLVKATNAGPTSTTHITSMGGGPDMPIFVELPTDADTAPTDATVEIDFGGLARTVPVTGPAWSTQIDTRTIQNGARTLTASPRASYDGVERTGMAETLQVTVQNSGVNTAPTATLTFDSASGPTPHAVNAVLAGSDAQTAASALRWSIDWGDGSPVQTGTGLPTSLSHAYQAAGAYVARLTVRDAGDLVATSEVAVSAFEPEPVEKVVVLVDGAAPIDATDGSPDGSFASWSATVDVATLGLHTITARHMRGTEVLSESALDVRAVAGFVVTIVGPEDGAAVAPGSTLSGTTGGNAEVVSVVASLDPTFATSVAATSGDGFATWSVPLDALGLAEDAYTDVYVRASSARASVDATVELLLDGAPNARIEAPFAPEYTSEPLAFQSASTPSKTGAPIVAWAWSFGDGATSSETHPTHAYARGGVYDVTLAVTDDLGATGTTTRSVLVLNRAPAVSLAFSPESPTTADTVAFTAGATDADGTVQSLEIVAYDGTTTDAPALATGGSALDLRFPDDGAYLVEARATDDQGGMGVAQTLVTVSNLRPVASLVASAATVGVGQDVELNATGSSDPDGEVTSYRFDLGDGTIVEQDQPVLVHQYDTRGIYFATVKVTDDDMSAIESAAVRIVANAGPTLAAIGNKVVDEGQSLAFTVTATDEENDPLTYSVAPLPAGASFHATSGAFSWTPTFQQTGNYELEFRVSDGRLVDSERVILSVGDVPLPPSLAGVGSKSGAENALLTFRLQAVDQDTPQLTFGAEGLPTGASLDAASGVFAWTPDYTQAGAYDVRFTVTDGTFTDDETVTITIGNTDRAPVLQAIPAKSILQLATLQIPLTATDADGDAITWTISGPPGATVRNDGNGRAMLLFTPTTALLGPYTTTVTAMAGGVAASKSTVLTVLFKADLALTPITPSTTVASPGDVVTLEGTLKNTGPNTDTFRISVTNTQGWTLGAFDEYVTLAPNETAHVSVDVTTNRSKPVSFTTISALSLGDDSSAKSARLRVLIPVVIQVVMDDDGIPSTQLPRGKVHTSFLDGSPADGTVIGITQTPSLLGMSFRSTITATTDANGDYRFDMSKDPKAIAPGEHELYVTARLPSGLDSIERLTYTIAG